MNVRISYAANILKILLKKRRNCIFTEEAEAELCRNDVYKISDKQTKEHIRNNLKKYSAKHKLTVQESAKLFSLRPDCGFFESKKSFDHSCLTIPSALVFSAVAAAAVDSYAVFFLLSLPFMIILFELYSKIRSIQQRQKPLPCLEKTPDSSPAAVIFLNADDTDTLKARIEKHINASYNDNMRFSVLIFQKPSTVIYSRDDAVFYEKLSIFHNEIKKKHGDILSIYVIKRSYVPAKHMYECGLSELDALRAWLENDRSYFELALVPDRVTSPDAVICITGDVDLETTTADVLIRSCLHPLSRSEISGNTITFFAAETKEYVPIKHTLFSLISYGRRTLIPHINGKLSEADDMFPSQVCAVNIDAFLKLYGKSDMNFAICKEAKVYSPRQGSPVEELSAAPHISVSQLKEPLSFLSFISYLSPVSTIILIFISQALGFAAGAVLMSSAAAAYLLSVLLPFSATDGIEGADFIRRAEYYTASLAAKGIYYISLLPSLAVIRTARSIRFSLNAGELKRDSAGQFFEITLFSALGEVLALNCGGSALRVLGLLFVLAPVFTIVLTVPVQRKHRRSRIINEHISRSYKVYTDFLEKKNPVISENERYETKEGTFSPSDLGMYLCAALAYYDLEIIPLHELYMHVSDVFDIMYSLPVSDGLFYNCNYLSNSDAATESEISIKENGMLFTCLITLREGLSGIFGESDVIVKRCEAFIKRADIAHLTGKNTQISDLWDPSVFLAACFSGDRSIADKMPLSSFSEYGDAYSILYPYLFMPVYPCTETKRNIERYYHISKKRGRSGMFGATAGISIELDDNGENIYKSKTGIREFSLFDLPDDQHLSPYACFAMLGLHPSKVIASLYSFKAHGAFGKKGFYDSVSITDGIIPVRSYSLSGICASVISAANYYKNGIFIQRFSRSAFVASDLHCLRKAHNLNVRISENNLPSKQQIKNKIQNEKYDVPRICLLSGRGFTIAASDEGHIVILSDGKKISADCFDRYDMSNTSASFSVFCRADGRCFDALSGNFSYDALSVTYGRNLKTLNSKLVFALSENDCILKIRLSVKGDINDASAVLSFNTPLDFIKSDEALIYNSDIKLKIYKEGGKEGYIFCEDGICEIAVSDKDAEGYFTCDFVFEITSDSTKPFTVCPSKGLMTEAILASYFLCAGEKIITDNSYGSIRSFDFDRPLIAVKLPSPAANLILLSALSKYCAYLRSAGIDIYLAVIADECDFSAAAGYICESDFLINSSEETAKAAESYSVMFIDSEGMSSPERFFRDIMSHARRLPELRERAYMPDFFELPKGASLIGTVCFKGGENILIKTDDAENTVFSLGDSVRVVFESDRICGIYFNERKICERFLLSAATDDGDYDIIAASHTLEKNGCIALYKTRIKDSDILTEIFCDENLSSIVVRVIGRGFYPSLSVVPKAPHDDPRLIESSFSDGTVFYSSRFDEFLSENKIFVKELLRDDAENVFAVGVIPRGDERGYYKLCERYSSYSGCESPVANTSLLIIKSGCRTADHLISIRIPELFNGFYMTPDTRIYAFPYLALTDPEMLKRTIIEFALSADINAPESIVLPAALAAYYSFSGNDEFLRNVFEYGDGVKESIYLHSLRIIENYTPKSGEETFIRDRLNAAFMPLCTAMNDRTFINDDFKVFTDIRDPVIKSAILLEEGKNAAGYKALLSCIPDFSVRDPRKLSLFYYVYMFDLIGISGENGIIKIDPKLSESFPCFKMTITRGNTVYQVEANLGNKNEKVLDGIMFDGGIICDGMKHSLRITALQK